MSRVSASTGGPGRTRREKADSNLTATAPAEVDEAGGRHRAAGRPASKRGNAEGSIWQRADGRWVAAFHDANHRRVQRYATTRAGAAAKLAEGLRLQAEHAVVPLERQTVGEFLLEWLENSARRRVRPATFVGYAAIVRSHIVPEIGSTPLARLTPQQVQLLINRKSDSGLSPRRVQYIRAVLRQALRQAQEWGLVTRNVASLVRPPKAVRFEIRPLDPDQARALLTAIEGDRLEALYTVALSIGLRAGEALGLRWEDVDLERGELHVRKALQKIAGEWQLVEPKTDRSRRTISLPAMAVDRLREHREWQAAERVRAGELWDGGWDLVFTTELGRPLDNSNVTHRFQRILAEAGLPRQRFHDLRHACASLLLAQGVSPRVVMEILGHSQISMTLDTYSHVIPRLKGDAAGKMDEILGAGPDA